MAVWGICPWSITPWSAFGAELPLPVLNIRVVLVDDPRIICLLQEGT